jgi:hypothetical protein
MRAVRSEGTFLSHGGNPATRMAVIDRKEPASLQEQVLALDRL